ncbi:MAG: heme biosynthesis protein HemY [Halioglobus sp.]|nr:heme biosynthesis protein HemY [Halioglobus sp.]
MRKIFSLAMIALLLGVGLVAIIETDPGYLLLAYGNYTLESSLWVGLLLLFLFTALLYFLVAMLRRLLSGQKLLSGWLDSRRSRKATRLTNLGLVHYIEGNWSKARQELLNGVPNNDAPLVNHLLAARASAHLGEPEQTEEQLRAAAESSSEAKTAVALARAEIQVRAGKYKQAMDTLQEARRSPGRHPQVLTVLKDACIGLGDWAGLAELLPVLRKHGVLGTDQLQDLERDVYGRLLSQAGDASRGGTLDTLCDAWHKMPAVIHEDAVISRRYAGLLVSMGGHAFAEKTILRALKRGWDPELVRIFGYVESDNARRQLSRAEGWLADHPEDAQLFLCLGRLAARDKLWGKSRDYFEKSYRLHRSPEVCAELGRLLSALGEASVAAAYFREGLLFQENRLPVLPRPDKIVADPRLLTRS